MSPLIAEPNRALPLSVVAMWLGKSSHRWLSRKLHNRIPVLLCRPRIGAAICGGSSAAIYFLDSGEKLRKRAQRELWNHREGCRTRNRPFFLSPVPRPLGTYCKFFLPSSFLFIFLLFCLEGNRYRVATVQVGWFTLNILSHSCRSCCCIRCILHACVCTSVICVRVRGFYRYTSVWLLIESVALVVPLNILNFILHDYRFFSPLRTTLWIRSCL